jgi:hypothetical protein
MGFAMEKRGDLAHKLSKECDRGRLTYLAVAKRPANTSDLMVLKFQDKHDVEGRPAFDVREGSGASALHVAARHGNLPMLQWLVELKLDFKLKASNGATAAHDAAATGNVQCLECLLYHAPKLAAMPMNEKGHGAWVLAFGAQVQLEDVVGSHALA